MRQHLYERVKQPLAPHHQYRRRVLKRSLDSVLLLTVVLLIGMTGYHFLGGLPWIDSFLNATMIMGGMGPVNSFADSQTAVKIFSGIYALGCGVFFLFMMAYVLAPFFHRFLHRFHIDAKEDS